jgi:hypothetical protein
MDDQPFAGFSYNRMTGEVTIPSVRGNIVIIAIGVFTPEITLDGKDITSDGLPRRVDTGTTDVSFTLAVDTARFRLPDGITMTMGGSNFTGFSYNRVSGLVTIPSVTGNVVVTAKGIRIHEIILIDDGSVTSSDIPRFVDDGDGLSFTLEAVGSHVLPGAIAITMTIEGVTETLHAGTDYVYDSSTGYVEFRTAVIGIVVVNASGVQVYLVSLDGSGVFCDELSAAVVEGDAISFILQVYSGYRLPDDITMTMDSSPFAGFSYNNKSGLVTITSVMGNIVVTASAVITHEITLNGTNVTSDDIPAIADDSSTISFTLKVSSAGYRLPDGITVTMGGSPYQGFSYNSVSGLVTISEVTDIIVVTAAGVLTHRITLNGTDVTSDELPMTADDGATASFTLKVGSEHRLPSTITMTMDGQPFEGFVYNNVSGEVTITSVDGAIDITAVGVFRPEITLNGTNITSDGLPRRVDAGTTAVQFTLYVSDGRFRLPDGITMTMGGLPFAGFTYNSVSGLVTISQVTDNIVVTAAGVLTHRITLDGTDVTSDDLPMTVDDGATASFTLEAGSDHRLPDSIVVTMAGTGILVPDRDYTYDPSSGTVSFIIPVTGDVKIKAAAVILEFSVSGTVFIEGTSNGLSGAVITYEINGIEMTAVTDAGGKYVITFPVTGTLTITDVDKVNYTLTSGILPAVFGSDTIDADFGMTLTTYVSMFSVSGTVSIKGTATGLEGVKIGYTINDVELSVLTDAGGGYVIVSELGWSVTITGVTKDGHTLITQLPPAFYSNTPDVNFEMDAVGSSGGWNLWILVIILTAETLMIMILLRIRSRRRSPELEADA